MALAVLSLLGTVAILIATSQHGAGLSPDSAGYIATARHVAAGDGVLAADGTPLVGQPPLYPALLAVVANPFGVDPLSSANLINALLFGLIIYAAGKLSLAYLPRSAPLALLLAVYTATAIPLTGAALMAWSEPLFILLLLVNLRYGFTYLARPDSRSLLLFAYSAALMCLTRYIGVALVVSGAATVLIYSRERWPTRLRDSLAFTLLAAVPIGTWVLRNYALAGSLLGPRSPSAYTLSECLERVGRTLGGWFIPNALIHRPWIVLLIAFLVAAFLVVATKKNTAVARLAALPSGPLALAVCGYLGFLVYSSATVAYDPIYDRLVSPVFVPLALLLVSWVYRFLASRRPRRSSGGLMAVVVTAAVLLTLAHPLSKSAATMSEAFEEGQGYAGDSWVHSQTVAFVKHQVDLTGDDRTIYSDFPYALAALAGVDASLMPIRAAGVSSLEYVWPDREGAWLVWFDQGVTGDPAQLTPERLMTIADLDLRARLSDGAVYHVFRKSRPVLTP